MCGDAVTPMNLSKSVGNIAIAKLEKKGKTRTSYTSGTSQGVAAVPEPQMEVLSPRFIHPLPIFHTDKQSRIFHSG